jgi:mono/diheme cytochrome c family protein
MFRTGWLVAVLGIALTCGAYAATARSQEMDQKAAPATARAYDGQDQFGTYCASCHGRSARGDGVVGALLRKRPPDLTTMAARNGGVYDGELVYQIIDGRKSVDGHGGADMPVWGDAFSKSSEGSSPDAVKDRIAAIVTWLGKVQQKTPTP